jgi:hypothetical protein
MRIQCFSFNVSVVVWRDDRYKTLIKGNDGDG